MNKRQRKKNIKQQRARSKRMLLAMMRSVRDGFQGMTDAINQAIKSLDEFSERAGQIKGTKELKEQP